MAGIYLHIPFCRKACHYCDFYFSTSLQNKPALVKALIREIELQKDYLNGETIESIYFGGGTPSLLSEKELGFIFNALNKFFTLTGNPEITLEANPDDLTAEKIVELRSSPVNRLSIGIQSFFDKDLLWMNRSHSVQQATESVKRAQDAGLDNISIDLIYGLPDSSDREWEENLSKAFDLGVPHISSYCLTVEKDTALAHFIKAGKVHPTNEEKSLRQFEILTRQMNENDFVQYEISNFCKAEHYARHNSNYWKGAKYLGIGPSAHSYNHVSRQWNKANNAAYISSIEMNNIPAETETLTVKQQFNEYLMTSLRTMWGVNLEKVKKDFGEELFQSLQSSAEPFITTGFIENKNGVLLLALKGKFIADKIISELFEI